MALGSLGGVVRESLPRAPSPKNNLSIPSPPPAFSVERPNPNPTPI